MKPLLFILLGVIVAVAGCTSPSVEGSKKPEGSMIKTGVTSSNESVQQGGEIVKNDTAMQKSPFTGQVLAGSSAPLIDFNKADYDAALKSGKVVFLYFYANWCPICRLEVPQMYAAFNELKTDKIIGFRVNFNDDQTDDDERKLAEQFGIPYQHTKVFLKDGKLVSKFPDSWDKIRYITEINKILA